MAKPRKPRSRKRAPVARKHPQVKRAHEIARRIAGHWSGNPWSASGEVECSFDRFSDGRLWVVYKVSIDYDEDNPIVLDLDDTSNVDELIALNRKDWKSIAAMCRRESRERVEIIHRLIKGAIAQSWVSVFYEPETRYAVDRVENLIDLVLNSTSLGPNDEVLSFEYRARAPRDLEKKYKTGWKYKTGFGGPF
jgi:hypothetical protein